MALSGCQEKVNVKYKVNIRKQYQRLNCSKVKLQRSNATRYQKLSLMATFFASCSVEIVVYWRNMIYHDFPLEKSGHDFHGG